MWMLRSVPMRLALSIIVLASFAAFRTTAVAQAPSAGGRFRISGKVVNSTTGTPLSRALVTIASVRNRGEEGSVITGEDGVFEFDYLPPGKYSMQGAKHGFITSAFEQHENYSTAIVAGSDVDCEHLVFRLTPQAILSGRIFDEAGDPVRNARVSLYRQDRSTGLSAIRQVAADQTDDRGSYEFADLARGDYFVSVNAKPWYAQRQHSVRAQDGSLTLPAVAHLLDVAYPTTFYSDVTDSDEATPIPLRGGERLAVDIHLSPVAALRIVLRTTGDGEHGFPFPQILQNVFGSTEDLTQLMFQQPAGVMSTPDFMPISNTEFEFSGIPAGKYTVLMPDNASRRRAGSVVEVDLNRNGQVLDTESGEPASSAKFSVKILGEARLPQQLLVALQNSEHKIVARAPVEPNGEVQLLGVLPGKYVVLAATPTTDYAVVEIASSGSQSSGHSVDIPAGSTIEGTISLVSGTGSVEGFAKLAGKGVAGVMVVLVPKDTDANRELFRRDQSDLDGSFSLATVIPGEYTIVAIERGWDLDWSQPGVIGHYLEHGRKITVPSGLHEPVRLSEAVEAQPR